jgi:hypothetical protein
MGVACFLDGQFVGDTVPAFNAERQVGLAASPQGRADSRTNRPLPYRAFRMIDFRVILTFTSRITTISGRKIEMVSISLLLLVSRRGSFPVGFSILGLRCEQSLDAAESPDPASQQT